LRPTPFVSAPRSPDELRRRFDEDGFVAGGRLLDEAEVERLCAEFDRIFADRERIAPFPRHKRIKDTVGGEYYTLYNLHGLSPEFERVVTHPRLVEMLARLTGGNSFRVLLDQIQYKPPQTGGWNGWHRDMPSYPLIPPYTGITVWIALDDATEENGCMQMVPGSHLWGDASDLAGDGWALSQLPRTYQGHRVRPVSRPVRKGHVHFHHEMTWHCSPPNWTDTKRRALAIHYIGAEDRYREGGKIEFPELSQGASMAPVAPLVVTAHAT
jgi:ectoine hydroxylase-related dioxygenase (phytanoyl-CoA dioxygenase family)